MYGIGRGVYDACGSGMESIKLGADSFFVKNKIKSGLFRAINERGAKP